MRDAAHATVRRCSALGRRASDTPARQNRAPLGAKHPENGSPLPNPYSHSRTRSQLSEKGIL